MKILVTGSSGLIGSALTSFLSGAGHEVVALVRRPPREGEKAIHWDPAAGVVDAGAMEGFDGVVHLAGENVGQRWTDERKRRIRESRAKGTRLLAEALAGLNDPPKVMISASAVGYYGDRGEAPLDEQSAPGSGFLADVCREWEAAAAPAERKGIRVVNLRIGVVLSADGGALGQMLTPFKLGLGGRLGSGRQYMSWIARDDLVRAIAFALENESLRGPVNAVAPQPATNLEFTKTLGRALGRPTIFPMPAPVVKLIFGQMGEEMLLAGANVRPSRLQEAGFEFQFPHLEDALRFTLGRT